LQKELRAWATGAALLAIVTSALTLSRAGMLGLAVGIAVFAFASQRAEGRRVAPVAIAVALAALATIAYRALPQGPDTPNDLFNNGLGTRSQLWHAAVTLWRSHPWLGIGAGNYETQLGRVGLVGVRTHANSWYLQSLAEGGIVMFAAVVATIYGLVVTFLNSRAAFATAALAATAAICAHQIFDDLIFFPKVGAMWWIIVGVGAAAASTMRLDSAVRRPEAVA
jgi:O-antigen ligase